MIVLAGLRRVLVPLTDWLDRTVARVTGGLLCVIIAINALEIVARTLFEHSFIWLYESNLLLANWTYFLGICLVVSHSGDITVDFLYDRFGSTVQRAWLIAVNLVGMATLGVVAWYGGLLIQLQMPFRSTGFGIPNPLFSLPVVLGAVFMILMLARQSLDLALSETLPKTAKTSAP